MRTGLRRLPWVVAVAWLGACASSQDVRNTAFLRDARECEEDADRQLRSTGQVDNGIRILFYQSCMSLRGWPSQP